MRRAFVVVLAWLMFRRAEIAQVVGLVLIAVGFGFWISWPVGLVVAGVELTLLGVLAEMRPDAGTPS